MNEMLTWKFMWSLMMVVSHHVMLSSPNSYPYKQIAKRGGMGAIEHTKVSYWWWSSNIVHLGTKKKHQHK